MTTNLADLLKHIPSRNGVIYSGMRNMDITQGTEILLRERVAAQQYDNYLYAISKSHSISVMDHEVDQFLAKMPENAIILDVGGCWGLHWRRLADTRPDVSVLIIDFVSSNLDHAKKVLGPLVGSQIALMHADATDLPFKINDDFPGFNGVWTVQTFQHIPDFSKAVREAYRVLLSGGYFANYSLHATPLNKMIYWILGKNYHIKGEVAGSYYLERANNKQKSIVAEIFDGSYILDRYTENLFHPDLKFSFPGHENNPFGKIDILFSDFSLIARLISRQRSFLVKKV